MKKLLLGLVALFASCAVSFAATDVTQTGTIGIDIGSVWSLAIDGYSVAGSTYTPRGTGMYFGTVNMLPAGIYATTDGAFYATPHRAGNQYMDIRVYATNNQSPIQVSMTISGCALLVHSQLMPADGNTSESVMHAETMPLTAAMNAGATTTYPAYLQYRTDALTGNAAKANAKAKVANDSAVVLYDSGTAIVSDAFDTVVAVDFLPLTVPMTPTAPYTTWQSGSVTWTLHAKA